MRSEHEINDARGTVNQIRVQLASGSAQDLLLSGMSVALCWVMESSNGSTLQRLIDGELPVQKPNEG